ncbi:ATP-binding protein [Nostoc sp.]|uniref:ATP-binding protein n=1 Tax=Nostoc sp. TaxID=1180 RepID=UPI002FF8B7FC
MNTPTTQTCSNSSSYPREFQQAILEKSQNFVGRTFIFTSISDFLHCHNRGYFTIVGAPGSGKSAILAKYAITNPDVVYYNAQVEGKNCTEEFLRDVCTQLIKRIANEGWGIEIPDNATEGSWFLSLLLQKISDGLKPNQKLIIAIDALDAIERHSQPPGSNLFYLPRYLPQGVYFLLTRRPFPKEKSGLLIETPSQILDLAAYAEKNRQDVQAYIRQYLISNLIEYLSLRLRQRREDAKARKNLNDESLEGIDIMPHFVEGDKLQEEFITLLTVETENNFMFLSQILLSITEGFYLEPLQPEPLPPGLEAYYQQHWQKMTAEGLSDVALKILRVLTHLKNGKCLSAQAIARTINEDAYDIAEVLENWLEFLVQQRIDTKNYYSFYHSSFCHWLAQRLSNEQME